VLTLLIATRVTAESLENAMVVGPRQEASLFAHRDKFDLVAIYDSSSSSFGSESEASPVSVLFRVIFEQAFKKMLKRMPMLLVGGIQAWKREFGSSELIRGPGYRPEVDVQKPAPISPSSSVSKGTISVSVNGYPSFANGITNSMIASSNGTSSTPSDFYATKSGIQAGHHVIMSDQPGHSRLVVITVLLLGEMILIKLSQDRPQMPFTLVLMFHRLTDF
jgi:ubiquitin carboxyl-terminal hydrolase 8